MMRSAFRKSLPLRVLMGVVALLVYAAPGSAVLGVRRRTAVVAYSAGSASASSAAASQSAAAQQTAAAQSAAAQSAAAASQASAAAAEAAAASKAAAPPAAVKTPQQKLEELQSLFKQGLITESEYNAAKAKVIAEMSQ